MKAIVLVVSLALLVLSATYNEVLGKELTCYADEGGTNTSLDRKETCEGCDVVCITAIGTQGGVVKKACGERNAAKWFCGGFKCEVCDTDLCNNKLNEPYAF